MPSLHYFSSILCFKKLRWLEAIFWGSTRNCTDTRYNKTNPRLGFLAQKIEQSLLQWCQAENRSFVSHATIARIKQLENQERLLGLFRKLSVKPIQFTTDSFVLKESELSAKGPAYIDKVRYKLDT